MLAMMFPNLHGTGSAQAPRDYGRTQHSSPKVTCRVAAQPKVALMPTRLC